MKLKEALSELETLGSEKMRAQNAKRGAGENQYGVRMGDIRKLAKKIKKDQELALLLWDTKIIDAQLLSTLIIEPQSLSVSQMNKLVNSTTFFWVADWFNSYVAKLHPAKEALREKWMSAKNPWAARAGWSLTALRVARDAQDIDVPALLDRLEKEMPKAKSDVQWTMNMALVEIGINHPKHRKRAIAIGETLGLYRDYPVPKGCTSPFAPIWIEEMVKRQK